MENSFDNILEESPSPVYARLDENGYILAVEGGYTLSNIQDMSQWTLIDQGVGSRYDRAQVEYLPDGLYTHDGIPRYRWDGEQVVERDEKDIEADRAAIPEPEPSEAERLRADVDFIMAMEGLL